MANSDISFEPPPEPPPLLQPEQIRHLAYQGWLPIQLPPELGTEVQELSRAASVFFDDDNGRKQDLYPRSRGTECGYYTVPEEKEYLTLRHATHDRSQLECIARRVWNKTASLLHRILCDLSRAGDFDLYAWDHLLEGSMHLPADGGNLDDVTTLMRLFRYRPTHGAAAEHVDIGLLTLCVGYGTGLQVFDLSKEPSEWVDATTPIILAGDTLRSLLRGRVRAGLHRVVGNQKGRSSIVFALRPGLTHPTDLAAFGGKGLVDTREYFYKIKGARHNVNATKDIREQQLRARELRRKRAAQADALQHSVLEDATTVRQDAFQQS